MWVLRKMLVVLLVAWAWVAAWVPIQVLGGTSYLVPVKVAWA
jgi:hypothetical protein